MNTPLQHSLTPARMPFVFILVSALVALGLALLIVITIMAPPARDVLLLVMFMGGTAAVTLLAAVVIRRLNLMSHFPSLRWVIPVTVVLTAALIVFNVWVTARLMFISDHDFYLTTALLVFASLTATGFGLYITTHLTNRLAQFSGAATALASGRFDEKLAVEGSDEIARLATTFNWMVDNLARIDQEKRAIEQTRRDLIAWVSHDLRTPLSTIRVMLEAIQDSIVTDETTRQRYIANSLKEIQHLSRLINDLFELAQLDGGQLALNIEAASLRDLISDTISSMSARAAQRQITLQCEIDPEVDRVYMDAHKIQQVLNNLVDNALRYTPAEGMIMLRACQAGGEVVVEVHNSGATIAPHHLPHIFDSFYRVETSRPPDEDGRRSTGLGLTIARRLVEAHQGHIEASSTPQDGTTFRFVLPRVPPR